MPKDWVGNQHSIMVTTGASGHADHEREKDDYYATEPRALELLLEKETFKNVWEPACGEGHLAEVLKAHNILGRASDLVNRGYGEIGLDFLLESNVWRGDIITNPPYKYAQQFIEQSMQLILDGNKVAMFLKIQFLEGKSRKKMFAKYPPHRIYVSSSRLKCALGGNFDLMTGSASCYAWYVWVKGFKGDPIIKWIN